MAKRVSIAVCLTLGAAFFIGAGCSSIPDHRETLPADGGGGENPDGGGTGGSKSTGGSSGMTSAGGNAAAGAAGMNAGGRASGGGRGAGGRGGATSAGGTGTAGADGGMMSIDGGSDAGPVGLKCGASVCSDRAVGRNTYAACCAGAKKDRCGLDTTADGGPGCVESGQAGALDSVCRDLDSADGNTTYYGCCRSDAKCGVVFQLPGGPNFGCVDPTELGLAAGKDCTPAACTADGAKCTDNSECCPGPAGDPLCLVNATAGTSVCTDYCITNRDCASGCCTLLVNGRGACALEKTACTAACRKLDETCDSDADCCAGNVCAPNSDFGPRLCRPKCTTNASCMPEFCAKDEAGRGACTTDGAGLCTDTCTQGTPGSCDDGGTQADSSECALGTDCTDCGGTVKSPRLGGVSVCFDSCSTHGNGKCEDGGPGSSAATCAFGHDCTDCEPRLGICSNDCYYSMGGTCDDGGPNAGYSDCSYGTDCADCGVRFGGRGQGLCDGSVGAICVPSGGIKADDIGDGICQCKDCPWDVKDCKTTINGCDGKMLGACCAPGNPCHLALDDGLCVCGGWCDWETPDCGNVFPPPICDGSIKPGCDYDTPDPMLKANKVCDCQGACSWEAADCTSLNKLCTDTCKSADDGTCDDDGVTCTYGTDCRDCGPRFPK